MSALTPPRVSTDPSFRGVARLLAELLPGADLVDPGQPALEVAFLPPAEAPRTISAELIEDETMRVRTVPDDLPVTGFAAFLDGTQASRALHYTGEGVPIVHGLAAAVVRERRGKRLATWRHDVTQRLYLPRARVSRALWQQLAERGVELRDTGQRGADQPPDSGHPLALRDDAIHHLQRDRENIEQRLARDWLAREKRAILIDGGISGADEVAHSESAIGLVKSHRTLYADGDALACVFRLRRAERSSVFRVTSPKRTAVASWYLRVRDRQVHDPMWGLVRIEVAVPARARASSMTARADEVSRWILAEALPVALPDSRWDKMVYGIRDCEEFLRAIV
jgi:hypothetical protein